MNYKIQYIKTIYKIGIKNVFFVLIYRFLINSYIRKIFFPVKKINNFGEIFAAKHTKVSKKKNIPNVVKIADDILEGYSFCFSFYKHKVGELPNWFQNPFNKKIFSNNQFHWTKLNDFDNESGDIKNIWEISRFNCLGTLSYAYLLTDNIKYLKKVNNWVIDWIEKNPPNIGPNWKCGQEASIRSINILLCQFIMGNEKISKNLKTFLKIHIYRIYPTVVYAKAQNNNHGISEAVALYSIGYFLWKNTKNLKFYYLHYKGLKLLENRVKALIMNDGSFSQYSTVYHRMMLDLISVAEILRKKWCLKPFSKLLYKKVDLAITFMSELTDQFSGNSPNIGGNDGTYLFNYDQREYRDFRPSISLASATFDIPIKSNLIQNHCLLNIFDLEVLPMKRFKQKPKLFKYGGFARLNRESGFLIFRIPKFKFRPAHADALHLDIWEDGINWIRDAGTYSYALNMEEIKKFVGTEGHSTIQFNEKDQMPHVSKFLFLNWLEPTHIKFNNNSISSGYTDLSNINHNRFVEKIHSGWRIIDSFNGPIKKGKMRWILNPGNWELKKNSVLNQKTLISFNSKNNFSYYLSEGLQSIYYMDKNLVPVLNLDFSSSGEIVTEISFN